MLHKCKKPQGGLEGRQPLRYIQGRQRAHADAAAQRVSRFLSSGDLSPIVPPKHRSGQILSYLMKNVFSKGIPDSIALQAFLPGSLDGMLRGEVTGEEDLETLDEAASLQDISHMPARVKCAMLGWRTMKEILEHPERSEHVT